MSKKLAAGLNALVLDVKTGTGAFMSRYADAQLLARLMVETGELAGTRTVAVLTSMDQPLGRFAGNWVEVRECLELFQHFSPEFPFTLPSEKLRLSSDLLRLTHALAGHMLHLGDKAVSPEAGTKISARLLQDGSAYRHFLQMVELQSETPKAALAAFADPVGFHRPTATRQITSSNSGYLNIGDCTKIGWAVQRLGVGRTHPGAPVSNHAGLEMHAKVGDKVEPGQPLVTLFSEDEALLDEPEQMLRETLQISPTLPTPIPLIREVIAKQAL